MQLPDGLRQWWEGSNRSAQFAGSTFMLAASASVEIGGLQPGVQLLRLDSSLNWQVMDIGIAADSQSADIFKTGSRLAVSYLDPAGEIVVLTTSDGSGFDEARLPMPPRYVVANTWEATSLVGNLRGAADLGEEVFAIVNTGVQWTRPNDLAQRYAAEQDPENANSIRFANTIRSQTTDDGDTLFKFEKDGRVVAEVLGSEAGIEPGYIEAYGDRDSDTFEAQSWMISGSNARNLDTPPLGGQSGLRIHAVYPVEDGVGVLVTDFNFEDEPADAFGAPGTYAAGTAVNLGRYSTWHLRTLVTLDGILWLAEAIVGVPNPQFGSFFWGTYEGIPLFILAFYADGKAGIATSTDGSDWQVPDYTIDISLPGGGSVEVQVTGENTIMVFSRSDGSYEVIKVVRDEASGETFVEPLIESVLPELLENQVAVPVIEPPTVNAEGITIETMIGDFIIPPYPSGD